MSIQEQSKQTPYFEIIVEKSPGASQTNTNYAQAAKIVSQAQQQQQSQSSQQQQGGNNQQ